MVNENFLEFVQNQLGNKMNERITNNSIFGEKDAFSEIYENYMKHEYRKEYGQFFTHKKLVDYIISNLPINSDSNFLDPACGAGAFLSAIRDKIGPEVQLYGVDIDNLALELCKFNLQFSHNEGEYNLYNLDAIKQVTAEIFPSISAKGGFDFIVGNPPFQNLKKGRDFDDKYISYEGITSGVVNSSTLFIAKSLELLREGGWLGFVLQKNFLRVDSFKKIRNYILESCTIHQIFDIGHYFRDVRCDQIILILEKRKLSKEELVKHNILISILNSDRDFDKPKKYEIKQSLFVGQKNFPVFIEPEVYDLKNKLSNCPMNLESVSKDIFRGFSIGSNHPSITKKKTSSSNKIIRGKSIKRFSKDIELYMEFENSDLLSPEDILRQKKSRVVLQNIISKEGGLAACICESGCYSLDTVTNVVLEDERYNKYVMGLLNSRISNFFVLVITFLHSNFTMHADKMYIGEIPVIIPNTEQKQKIEGYVDELCKLKRGTEKYWSKYDEMNEEFFSIYELSKKEINLVKRVLSMIMSVKSNG